MGRVKRFSDLEMERVGVVIINVNPVQLLCKKCGESWDAQLHMSGRFRPGYWICPNGCNFTSGTLTSPDSSIKHL
jgi:hypothetical protein